MKPGPVMVAAQEPPRAIAERDSGVRRFEGWLIAGALLLLWGYAVYRLGALWYSNPEYSYGWFVPLLSLCLFWERWKRRPGAEPATASTGPLILFAGFAFSLLPSSLGLEVNPSWRSAGWALAGAVVGITFCVLYLLGGRRWLHHFAFPILFFLVAVPWHTRLELPLIDTLARINASISTWAANLLGTPAIRQGVLIETANGFVNIDEACSGIRSLQATFMLALFLGELFHYSLSRRIFFLFSGIVLAFVGNVVRTTYLVRISDLQGNAAVNTHHDTAGLAILGATLAGLLLLAWMLHPRKSRRQPETSSAASPVPMPQQTPVGAGSTGAVISRPPHAAALRILLVILAVWIVSMGWGIQAWFRSSEERAVPRNNWSLQMPLDQLGFTTRPVQESLRDKLRFDDGTFAEWQQIGGARWQMYYLCWHKPRGRYRAIESTKQARGHSTDLCLQLAGMELQKDFGTRLRRVNGVALLTRMERFLDRGRAMHVFSCYWEPDVAVLESGVTLSSSPRGTMKSALREVEIGDRGGNEKRVMKMAVWGLATDEQAGAAFEDYLGQMVRRD